MKESPSSGRISMATAQRRIGKIRVQIRAIHNEIEAHPLYQKLTTVEGLRIFMEHHVFAVWGSWTDQKQRDHMRPWSPARPRACTREV